MQFGHLLNIINIVVKHPDDGRNSDRNTQVNINIRQIIFYECAFVGLHVQILFNARIWNM